MSGRHQETLLHRDRGERDRRRRVRQRGSRRPGAAIYINITNRTSSRKLIVT